MLRELRAAPVKPPARWVWEHTFVTAQGSPLTRYRRAIERRSLVLAETAAREATFLTLSDVLGLVSLYAAADDPKFPRAAARWLGRLAMERSELGVIEIQLAAAALAALPVREEASMRVLLGLSC
jgi:hypothetical protein